MANLMNGTTLDNAVAYLVKAFVEAEDGSGVMTAEEFKALAFSTLDGLQTFEYAKVLKHCEFQGEFTVDPESGMVSVVTH